MAAMLRPHLGCSDMDPHGRPNVTPYDALAGSLLRGARGARRRGALPGERRPRARGPGRAAGPGGRPLPALRGHSPINGTESRALMAALRRRIRQPGIKLPLLGNRNSDPYLADTLAAMREDGVSRAPAFATSPYWSYSSCRQYLEDIEHAAAAGPGRAAGRQAPPFPRPPGVRRARRRRPPGLARRAARHRQPTRSQSSSRTRSRPRSQRPTDTKNQPPVAGRRTSASTAVLPTQVAEQVRTVTRPRHRTRGLVYCSRSDAPVDAHGSSPSVDDHPRGARDGRHDSRSPCSYR